MNFLTKVRRKAPVSQVINCSFGSRASQPGMLCEPTRNFNSFVSFTGLFPPITTPFGNDGKIAWDKLQKNFKKWEHIPFAGYVVMGSNGEAVALEAEEKLQLVRKVHELAVSQSGGSRKVLAGLGLPSTTATVDLCQKVGEEKIADAALIITPSFYKGQMTDSVLGHFFETVADKSDIPVVLYNVPANTGVDMSEDLIVKLAAHPNIVGLKESGGDVTKIGRIVYETKGLGFQVLAGSAGFLLPSLFLGCVGGVCAAANILGKPICDMIELFYQNKISEALSLHYRLIEPNTLVTRKYGVAGLKHAMDLLGYYGGPCRPPLRKLSEPGEKDLQRVMRKHGFL